MFLSHILSHIKKYNLVIETTKLAKSSIKGPISIAMFNCRCGPIDRTKILGMFSSISGDGPFTKWEKVDGCKPKSNINQLGEFDSKSL